jgi:AraC-like DNA-binding protein
VESFAIFFQPLAFSQLFHIPMSVLVNFQYDGCDVVGADIQQLWHKMAETSSFPRRVEFVEEYLLGKAANSLRNTPVVNAALHMFASRGIARISDVASQSSLGLRQFERRFASEIGLSPKLYSRVARFQAVLDAKVNRQDIGWLNLAYDFGYFDQAHMIKDFQSLSGFTPECLLLRLGDMRPPALAAAYKERHIREFD